MGLSIATLVTLTKPSYVHTLVSLDLRNKAVISEDPGLNMDQRKAAEKMM